MSADTVMVPRVPTEAMLMAARGLIMARDLQAPNGETTLGDVARSGFYGEHWRDILTDEERAIAAPLSKGHFAQLIYRAMLATSPQGEGSSGDPAPIKPSGDTGELRDDILERLRALDFAGHYDEARFQYVADTILDLIQSERGAG